MTDCKIFASDLDGTLLDGGGRVTEQSLAAIGEVAALGVEFVPASGRTLVEIPRELMEHGGVRYVIHSSGAAVYDKLTGERISLCFPRELSEAIFDILFSSDCHLTVRHGGRVFTPTDTAREECYAYYNISEEHARLLRTVAERDDDLRGSFYHRDEMEMFVCFFHDDGELERVKSALRELGGINIALAFRHNLELTYCKAGKGNALRALAHKLGVPMSSTVAMGDSDNDLPMLRVAGLGLAVSNATAAVRAEADRVICSNEEGAVRYVLNNLLK